MAVVAALIAGVLLLVIWGRPRLAFVAWVLSLVTVPVWISVDVSATLPAHSVVGLLAIAATISKTPARFNRFDYYFAIFLAISLLAVLLAGSIWASWAQIFIRWGIAYAAARVLVSATGTRFAVNVIAVLFGIIGGVAVLEFVLQWHPFVGWETGTVESNIWHKIQTRGGTDRSEWAFGHSIALGASLAMSIPFILRSSLNALNRWMLLILVGAGIATTGSRGALVAAGVTAALSLVYFAKQRALRTAALTFSIPAALSAAIILGPLLARWARGGSSEEQASADYRNYLYTTYVPKFEWFGKYPDFDITRANLSIDSEIVILGLSFGWLVLVIALIPICVSTARVLIGRATAAEIAIIGQAPVLATVAFITQYESVFFLMAAMAVQFVLEGAEKNRGLPRFTDAEGLGSANTVTAYQRPSSGPLGHRASASVKPV
ncbi:hypothetical protein [Mycolicibacterium pyrenivorans]|uniref:hypothetical protein n=1 Tax=Mycolicibacterium pyrenivorans TaxID=187102 RepID=UPI0021F3A418|nr:hypothetical protein [Mycolicibacterium pyrenivorans]MCV7151159.1 hypothetical protein [Mycolicibacterium pyrenivorans]